MVTAKLYHNIGEAYNYDESNILDTSILKFNENIIDYLFVFNFHIYRTNIYQDVCAISTGFNQIMYIEDFLYSDFIENKDFDKYTLHDGTTKQEILVNLKRIFGISNRTGENGELFSMIYFSSGNKLKVNVK